MRMRGTDLLGRFIEWMGGLDPEPAVQAIESTLGKRFLYFSTFYMPWRSRRHVLVNLLFVAVHLLNTALLFASCTNTLLHTLSTDFNIAIQNLMAMYYLNYNFIATLTLFYKRKFLVQLFLEEKLVLSGMEEDLRVRRRKHFRLARPATRVLHWYILASAVCLAFVRPLAMSYLKRGEPCSDLEIRLPIETWVPYNCHHGLPYWVILFMQQTVVVQLEEEVMSIMALYIHVTEMLVIDYKVLYGAVRGLKTSDRQRSMREIVIHHQRVLRTEMLINEVYKGPMLVVFITMSAMLATGLYGLFKITDTTSKLINTMLSVAIIVIMGLISLLGERVTHASKELRQEVYFSGWEGFDQRTKRSIAIIQERAKKLSRVIVYGFNQAMNLETYATVLNTAYSAFNLLLALNE